jgi:integrase
MRSFSLKRTIHLGKNKYTIPSAENNKRPLATEDITRLLTTNPIVLLSSMLLISGNSAITGWGINLRDVIKLQWSNVHDDKIYYYRSKTFKRSKVKRKNTVFLDDRTTAVIDKYRGTGAYIFNVLDDSMSEEQKYRAGKNLSGKSISTLKRLL